MTKVMFRPDGTEDGRSMEFLAGLGKGRAAEVHLVKDLQTGELYAEKIFKARRSSSELGRDIIYWFCFQAPFPYSAKEDAIRATVFRRKVLRELTEIWFGRPLVADGCYTRWDADSRGYVLGSEYIKGKGPKPGDFDPHFFRHLVIHAPIRFCKQLIRMKSLKVEWVHWEIDDAVTQLDELRVLFHQAGFIGSVWQVDKRLSVPTSNLLKNENEEWMLIDAESGMPALLMLRHFWETLKFGSFPLFDDTDFIRLRRYLADNHASIIEKIGTERMELLEYYVDQLRHHTQVWKSSEPAIFTHKHRLLTDSRLRSNIRKGFAEYWFKCGHISAEKAQSIERSALHFMLYWHLDFWRNVIEGVGIIGRSIGSFVSNFAQSVKLSLRVLWSAFFDDAYLKDFAQLYVSERIDEWQASKRLTAEEADVLRDRIQSPNITEYLKGFMVHLGLNLLEPPFIGNIIVATLAIALNELWILVFFFIGPMLRTFYTLFRMFKNRGNRVPYATALIIGAMPKIGTIAYPVQMSAAHPNLSRFLARWQLSSFACHVPLFGGIDSRLEHFFIRAADLGPSIQYELVNLFTNLKSVIFNLRRKKK